MVPTWRHVVALALIAAFAAGCGGGSDREPAKGGPTSGGPPGGGTTGGSTGGVGGASGGSSGGATTGGATSGGGSSGGGSSSGATTGGSSSGGGTIFLPGGSPATTPPPATAIQGKRAIISPGHGWIYYASLGRFSTQRGVSAAGLNEEDFHTAEFCNDFLIPDLERAGMRVWSCRERDKNTNEAIVDDDAGGPHYAEHGTWTTGSVAAGGRGGGRYRYALTAASETAVAWWVPDFPADGRYAVYAWWSAGTNRTRDARYFIFHSGGRSMVSVDQTQNGSRWVYLGTWHFEKGMGRYGVGLSNQSNDAGKVVVADSLRFGGGMSTTPDAAGRMNNNPLKPRWQEGAFSYVPFVGAPASIGMTSDVTIRPHYADWQGGDVYVSVHTNASGQSGNAGPSSARGTVTYTHDTNPSPGSVELANRIQNQLISDIRAGWEPGWQNRGLNTANFGEVRECRTMPACLIELLFHDNDQDARAMNNDAFRILAARAVAKGVGRYLSPGGYVPPPLPPVRVTALNAGGGAVRVGFEPAQDPLEPAAATTGFKVYASRNGKGFDDGTYTLDRSLLIRGLQPGGVYFFRVSAVGPGGESAPSEVLAVRVDPQGARPKTLIVTGYDRVDESISIRRGDNTFDYTIQVGAAIAAAGRGHFTFDSCSNEAVLANDVSLSQYQAVIWLLGNESTAHESFSAAEQALVSAYVSAGGRLFASGAEIAWDLGRRGSAADQAFLAGTLGAAYQLDDSGVDTAVPAAGSIFAGLGSIDFGKAKGGAYVVGFPDVLSPQSGATACLLYAGTQYVAGVDRAAPNGGRVIYLGFPFEAIASPARRAEVMTRVLDAFLPGHP